MSRNPSNNEVSVVERILEGRSCWGDKSSQWDMRCQWLFDKCLTKEMGNKG